MGNLNPSGGPSLAACLEGCARRTHQHLDEFLPQSTHERYLYGLVREHLKQAGKGLRPTLCLTTCSAFSGDQDHALNTAAALELLHNAFLVHDDIEDESEYRRNRPTMYTQYGIPLAINAGDAMQALAMRLLKRNMETLDAELSWRIFDEFDHMLIRSLEGQAMELGWIRDNNNDISEQDYYRLILKKTCWYSFIHPCRLGAMIARPNDDNLDRFNRFGYYLGAAFQIQDDVLNLIGEKKLYGKEINGDLFEGKRTLITAHAFDRSDDLDKTYIHQTFGVAREKRTAQQISRLRKIIELHGSIDYARTVAEQFLEQAEKEFEICYRDAESNQHKALIESLMQYIIARQR